MAKAEKDNMTNSDLQNITDKTKDRATITNLTNILGWTHVFRKGRQFLVCVSSIVTVVTVSNSDILKHTKQPYQTEHTLNKVININDECHVSLFQYKINTHVSMKSLTIKKVVTRRCISMDRQ